MKKETAHEIRTELAQKRDITGGGWYVSTQNERQEAYSRDFAYRDVWTVEVGFKKERAEIDIPSDLIDLSNERGLAVTLDLSGLSERWSRNPDYQTRFILNDGEFDKIEYTEEEQKRIELQKRISRNFDVDRQVAETLSEHFDSLDEILSASRDELTEIQGIGNTRASKILHRYSTAAKTRMEGRKSGILVIPDQDGVLRLPEEFESGKYTPDYSRISSEEK